MNRIIALLGIVLLSCAAKPASGQCDLTQTAHLFASDAAANDTFGNAIAVSSDTIIVGAMGDDNAVVGVE